MLHQKQYVVELHGYTLHRKKLVAIHFACRQIWFPDFFICPKEPAL